MNNRPKAQAGLRHVALNVQDLQACLHFYSELMGMAVEWQPDEDNVYLTSGNDNLALHRISTNKVSDKTQSLDHIGFIIDDIEEVDVWHQFLAGQHVPISKTPKTHRDGARSFYCHDPDGNSVQILFHPPLSKGR